jgi:hypothetical protein
VSGRIRTVKPEWLDDEKLGAASDAARLLTVGLMLLADDHGRGRAHPLFLASRVWSYGDSHETLTKLEGALSELSQNGFVRVYSVAGQRYFAITNWAKHQKVQHVGKPRVPGPDDPGSSPEPFNKVPGSVEPHETLTKPSGDSHEILTPDLRPHTTDLIPPTTTTTASAAAPSQPPAAVREVFDHWRSVMGKSDRATLDAKRKRLIAGALKSHGLEACKRAIDGYRASAWHQGKNPDRKVYDSLELVLRDAAHIEAGIEMLSKPGQRAPSVIDPERAAESQRKALALFNGEIQEAAE